jgi:hypothetical protein
MRHRIAEDAKPQLLLLLLATAITLVLWFMPYADYLVYPIRLFVTFIHESSHALIAVLTGGSVQSLTIASDGSGVVYSAPSGLIGGLLTSSAGYLGTMAFGVLLLFLIRRSFSPNKVLAALGIFVGVMTVVFTIISPVFHFLSLNTTFSSIAFTVIAGAALAAGLAALGIYAKDNVARFAVAFLAVSMSAECGTRSGQRLLYQRPADRIRYPDRCRQHVDCDRNTRCCLGRDLDGIIFAHDLARTSPVCGEAK